MPELLTRSVAEWPASNRNRGRLQIGTVAAFIPEPWPASSRNTRPACVGICTRLRFAGIRTSKRRVLRLTREHGLQAPHRVGRPHGPRAHDGTIRTERVDEMPPHAIGIAWGPRRWGTDMTTTLTGEGTAAVFVLVDHGSGECLGLHAAARGTRIEALEPLRQASRHSVSVPPGSLIPPVKHGLAGSAAAG